MGISSQRYYYLRHEVSSRLHELVTACEEANNIEEVARLLAAATHQQYR